MMETLSQNSAVLTSEVMVYGGLDFLSAEFTPSRSLLGVRCQPVL